MRRLLVAFAILYFGACGAQQKPAPSEPARTTGSDASGVSGDEQSLMATLRTSVKTDPATAVALANEGERRFPTSSLREEREALAIRALINLQQIGAARVRAEAFLRRYPNGRFANEVAAMTGVHLTPQGPPATGT